MIDDAAARELFEDLYAKYNRRDYVSPDPLQFLYDYDDAEDVEVVGLIASSLAYGRVASILASVSRVLSVLGDRPSCRLREMTRDELDSALDGFCHRFVKGPEMAAFLSGVGAVLRSRGSLEALFRSSLGDGTRACIIGAMDDFAAELLRASGLTSSHLMPRASLGSACKRLALYIRWMARRDDVDPGCWAGVPPSSIIIPLDTHMFRITTGLGFTRRRAADGRTALEVTDAFAAFCPDDPVKYDFALTRFGIRSGMSDDELLAMFGV